MDARVAELADALDLGSSGATRRGSTPLSRTTLKSISCEISSAFVNSPLLFIVPILCPEETLSASVGIHYSSELARRKNRTAAYENLRS